MRLRFDRGTVLLEELPPGLDPGSLPGALWDPRVRAYRAPACSHADLRSALSESAVGFDSDSLDRSRRTMTRVIPFPIG